MAGRRARVRTRAKQSGRSGRTQKMPGALNSADSALPPRAGDIEPPKSKRTAARFSEWAILTVHASVFSFVLRARPVVAGEHHDRDTAFLEAARFRLDLPHLGDADRAVLAAAEDERGAGLAPPVVEIEPDVIQRGQTEGGGGSNRRGTAVDLLRVGSGRLGA